MRRVRDGRARRAGVRGLAAWLPLSAVFALGGAAHAAGQGGEAELRTMVEAYYDELEALNPVLATFNGNHRYDDRLPNSIGPEHRAESLALERKYLAALEDIDPARLGRQARLTYDVFRYGRELEIEGYECPDHLLPVNQFGSMPLTFPQLGAGTGIQPFATTKDYENWLGRVAGFKVWMDQAIANMREGVRKGFVQPRVLIEKVLPQLDALIVDDVEQSLFWRPIETFPDAVGAADRTRLEAAYRKAILETINPAYRALRDYLRDEYLPKTRATVAYSAIPGGERCYAYEVKRRTTTRMTPDEIHRIGLEEVARIRAEMEKVKAQVGFEGDLNAFFGHLRADKRFYFDREEDLLEGYRALKGRVAGKLPKLFTLEPKADFEIRPVEAFRARSAAGGSYRSPSPDGSRPGVFYVNTFDLSARPKYAMEALYLHEAAPGHHFQIAIQRELEDLPRFRRFGGYTAYSEGWGLYAESLGKELGLYTDPYSYMGRLSSEIFRAARLVVDTGLHAKGWTREQAIEYMRNNRPAADTVNISEVERYIAIPGQALAYKVGELEIRELRDRAAQQLGSKFDLREFHTQVLIDGALPMDVLEKKIDRWIAEKAKAGAG